MFMGNSLVCWYIRIIFDNCIYEFYFNVQRLIFIYKPCATHSASDLNLMILVRRKAGLDSYILHIAKERDVKWDSSQALFVVKKDTLSLHKVEM